MRISVRDAFQAGLILGQAMGQGHGAVGDEATRLLFPYDYYTDPKPVEHEPDEPVDFNGWTFFIDVDRSDVEMWPVAWFRHPVFSPEDLTPLSPGDTRYKVTAVEEVA